MSTETLFPTNRYKLERLGALAAELLEPGEEPHWLLRRKEKVTLLDDTAVRRQMSVDFCLPKTLAPLGKLGNESVFYAPLFFLPKGRDKPFDPEALLVEPEPLFANFDLRDERGTALTLPARTWNAAVTTELLAVVMRRELERRGSPAASAHRQLRDVAAEICHADSRNAESLLDLIRDRAGSRGQPLFGELRELDEEEPRFARILEACAYASVVMMPLTGRDACRGILKLSFDEQVTPIGRRELRPSLAALGWAGYELWVQTPFAGASSYHFELEAPGGLEVYDAGLVALDRSGVADKARPGGLRLDDHSGYAPHLHLYDPDASGTIATLAWVRLRVRRGEFIAGAATAACFSAVVMWGAWVFRKNAGTSPSAVPTLLLLVPSVIAAYAARPTMHLLTAQMLRNARRLLALAAVLPFAAAGFFALTPRAKDGHVAAQGFHWFWLSAAILASLFAAALLGARAFPLPQLRVQRMKIFLQRHLALQFDDLPAPEPRPPWIRRWREGRIGRLKTRWRAFRFGPEDPRV